MRHMKIGTLAKEAGVAIDTLRYYERRGLLPEPDRSASGYRLYTPSDLERVRFVRRAQALGFTLAETESLLGLIANDAAQAASVLAMTRAKIDEQRDCIEDLRRIEAALVRLADACPVEAPANECPILAHLASGATPQLSTNGGERA